MHEKAPFFRAIFLPKRWRSAAFCLCAATLMLYAVHYPAAVGTAAASRQLPIYCVQRDQKLVAISFDAAWGNAKLRQSINSLCPKDLVICRNSCFDYNSMRTNYPE